MEALKEIIIEAEYRNTTVISSEVSVYKYTYVVNDLFSNEADNT
jgi:hypothetical protein